MTGLRSLVGVVSVALLGASCSLVAGLDGLQFTGGGGQGAGSGQPSPCSNDAQCDDANPCTEDSCSTDGLCAHQALPDGVDSPNQAAGDCLTNTCVAGKEKAEPDDADVADDHEECTTDSCNGGTQVHMPKSDLTACTTMGSPGSCVGGVCVVSCSDTVPCPDPGPCASVACDVSIGVCITARVPDGTPTPGVVQAAGDCHQRICVTGVDSSVLDPSDIPITPTDCDDELCDASGQPSNPANPGHPAGSPCSTAGGQVCNGNDVHPACVECTPATVGKCPGIDDDCQHRTCINDHCGIAFTAAGVATTGAPPQVGGDCHRVVCDGAGNATAVIDDADLPNDHNDCTLDLCSAGAVSHQNLAMGSICNGTLACSSSGSCTGCTQDSQCKVSGHLNDTCGGGNPGTAMVCGCTKTSCSALGRTCGSASDGCYGSLACDGGTKDGSETDVDCGGNPSTCATRCAQGKGCLVGADCASGFCADGVCCESPCTRTCLACTKAKKGAGVDGVCGAIAGGTDPDNECTDQGAPSCGTTGLCNGAGACAKYAAGTTCVAALCVGDTLNKSDSCDGSGTCIDGGTQDCTPFACATGGCRGSCAGDADCASGYFCSIPACALRKPNGAACTTANQCQSNKCQGGVCQA